MLRATESLKYRMIGYSIIIGGVSGLVVCSYRIFGEHLLHYFEKVMSVNRGNPIILAVIFLALAIMSFIVAQCVNAEPNISGSGIPQVEGTITRSMSTNWLKILIFKYVGCLITLAAGLSVGREGPSVQIGAAIGEGISKKQIRWYL